MRGACFGSITTIAILLTFFLKKACSVEHDGVGDFREVLAETFARRGPH